MSDNSWVVYLIRCSDRSLYCGISNNLHRRLIEHNSGKASKYTRSRRPVELIDFSPEISKSEALKLEHRVKKMPAVKKVTELREAQREIRIKRDIQVLRQNIKTLVNLIDKIIKET